MYYDYDDDDDDLQRLLEGRDVEDQEEPQYKTKRPSKKQPLYEGHGDEEVIRDDDDLEDFIENDEEDDLRQEAGDQREDGADYDEPKVRRDDEAVEAPSKPKVKRVVLNPQPKLDADRLKSDKGLVLLVKEHEKIRLKGKGHEAEDLDKIMFTLEHWGHRLFPKLHFDDFLERCEQLGHKKPVSVFVKKMRMGMPLGISSEFVDDEDDGVQRGFDIESAEPRPQVSAEEAFDQLFGSRTDAVSDPTVEEEPPAKRPEPKPLTDEQKAMIAQKRLEALERRAKKLREEQEKKETEEQNTEAMESNEASQEMPDNLLSTQELMDMF